MPIDEFGWSVFNGLDEWGNYCFGVVTEVGRHIFRPADTVIDRRLDVKLCLSYVDIWVY